MTASDVCDMRVYRRCRLPFTLHSCFSIYVTSILTLWRPCCSNKIVHRCLHSKTFSVVLISHRCLTVAQMTENCGGKRLVWLFFFFSFGECWCGCLLTHMVFFSLSHGYLTHFLWHFKKWNHWKSKGSCHTSCRKWKAATHPTFTVQTKPIHLQLNVSQWWKLREIIHMFISKPFPQAQRTQLPFSLSCDLCPNCA